MTLPFPEVYIFDGESGLLDSVLRLWNRTFEEKIRGGKHFLVALSGGKTPVPFYQRLAVQKRPDIRERTHFFLVDERFGAPDHRDSNGRMMGETLIGPAGIPSKNVHMIPLDQETPEESARAYEESLRIFFRLGPGEFPEFDFILLGIGTDGHTASLFPGTPGLDETQRAVVAVRLNEDRPNRITLTLPVLNRAARVVFLVEGEDKAEIVYRVIERRETSLPAARVHPFRERPIFFLDRGAGKRLSSHFRRK
jgi:6-phosphogluconolactonase